MPARYREAWPRRAHRRFTYAAGEGRTAEFPSNTVGGRRTGARSGGLGERGQDWGEEGGRLGGKSEGDFREPLVLVRV